MYMRVVCGCVMAGVILLLAQPGSVRAQKKEKGKDDGGNTTPGTPAEYAVLLQMKEVVGKLSNTSGKSLTFDIEYAGGNLNRGGNLQNYQQQTAKLMQQMNRPKTPQQQMRQLAQQMQKMQMQQMYNMPKNNSGQGNANRAFKEFDADLADNVVVRRNFVPFEYDDKGYVKSYTQAEVAAMRGKDSSKPGYTAKFDDLQAGQIVKLYLSKPDKDAKKADPKKDAKVDPKKPADDDAVVTKPVVTMILILAEPAGSATPNPPPKKKK